MVQWNHRDIQGPIWHNSQPVAEDHLWHAPAMHKMRMCKMRWRMIIIHLGKTHHPKVKVAQEHQLGEAAQLAKGPVVLRR